MAGAVFSPWSTWNITILCLENQEKTHHDESFRRLRWTDEKENHATFTVMTQSSLWGMQPSISSTSGHPSNLLVSALFFICCRGKHKTSTSTLSEFIHNATNYFLLSSQSRCFAHIVSLLSFVILRITG